MEHDEACAKYEQDAIGRAGWRVVQNGRGVIKGRLANLSPSPNTHTKETAFEVNFEWAGFQ